MKFDVYTGLDVVGIGGGVLAVVSVSEIAAVVGMISSVICAIAALCRFGVKLVQIFQKWKQNKITTDAACDAINEAADKLESEVKNNAKRD